MPREANEPVFHDEWERRMFGLTCTVAYPLGMVDDYFRREIERVPAATYLSASYYELWFYGVLGVLEEHGVTTLHEIDATQLEGTAAPARVVDGAARAATVPDDVTHTSGAQKDTAELPRRFAVGDRVRVLNNHPVHHTRVPRYVRGNVGRITMDHGPWVFPDSNSQYQGEAPQHVYAVEFLGETLWGADAEPGTMLSIDLFDSYLEVAE